MKAHEYAFSLIVFQTSWRFVSRSSVPTGGAAGGWEAKCSLMVLWCTGSGALFAVANSEVKTNSVNLLWQEVKMGKHIRWIYSSSLFAALLFILMKFVKMMHHLQMWAKNFTLLFVVSKRKGKIFNNVRNIIFAATIAVNYQCLHINCFTISSKCRNQSSQYLTNQQYN